MPFAPKPASQQGALDLGAQLCDLPFHDIEGREISLFRNSLFGWPKLVYLIDSVAGAAANLRYLAERHRDFAAVETHVIAITQTPASQNAEMARQLQLPYVLLSDSTGGLHSAAGLPTAADLGSSPHALFLDSLLRLRDRFAETEGRAQIDAALARAQAHFSGRRPALVESQAPALVLPNVVDAGFCRRLIEFWERSPRSENAVSSNEEKFRVSPTTKIRSDAYLALDSPEYAELMATLREALLPEIEIAFNFKVTRLEPFRIGCYDAANGGRFAPHRDNTTNVTRHRRYALTLNLNSGDYEGGFLRLPEYGAQLFAPRAGGCVVFSCSLLHMVTPVTRGRRFALIGFFWSEDEQPAFEESHPDIPSGSDFNLIRW